MRIWFSRVKKLLHDAESQFGFIWNAILRIVSKETSHAKRCFGGEKVALSQKSNTQFFVARRNAHIKVGDS